MNFPGGDSSDIHERKLLQDKTNIISQHKNLDDSFNDNDEAHSIKVKAEADRNAKYRQDLKEQCEENYRRSQDNHDNHEEAQTVTRETKKYTSELYQREALELEQQSNLVSDRTLAIQTERERKLKEKDDLNSRMCSQMEADEVDRQQREHILEVKHQDENRKKLHQEDEMAQEKHDEERKQLREGLLSQIEENKQSIRDEKQRELNFRDQANAVMVLEDEREKERARKKKEADDKYYADLRQQIADNKARRQKEKELDNA